MIMRGIQLCIYRERNFSEFLAVVDAVFVEPTAEKVAEARTFFREIAEKDGPKERAAPLALLELEARARQKDLGSEFGKIILIRKSF